MSLQVKIAFQGNLARFSRETHLRLARGARIGAERFAAQAKLAYRGAVRNGGLGDRLANTVRVDIYPKSAAKRTHAPAVFVSTKAPAIISAFADGVTIRHHDGLWLAIPTENTPNRGRRKATPQEVEVLFNQDLIVFPGRGGQLLAFVDAVRAQVRPRLPPRHLGAHRPAEPQGRTGADVRAGAAGDAAQAHRLGPRDRRSAAFLARHLRQPRSPSRWRRIDRKDMTSKTETGLVAFVAALAAAATTDPDMLPQPLRNEALPARLAERRRRYRPPPQRLGRRHRDRAAKCSAPMSWPTVSSLPTMRPSRSW